LRLASPLPNTCKLIGVALAEYSKVVVHMA
jgi:hypothetical protein